VRSDVFAPLDDNLGATMRRPWFKPPEGFEARRFDVSNGDTALFCWTTDGWTHDGRAGAYWLGNTETPSTLWRTDKFGFDEVPSSVADWAERELLAELYETSPWLEPYPHLSWFFLPVFLSKDGRRTTRAFFREHAAGFPDADADDALAYFEQFLATGALDDVRETMAAKLGTSQQLDLVRMTATMGEFVTARLLWEAGYDIQPEADVTTGHSLDFRVEGDGDVSLVEVTRPLPPKDRSASTAVAALRETAEVKRSGQLAEHGGGATLFVDCSSFPDDDWAAIRGERPDLGHRPAVVYRARPDGRVEAYSKGSVPLTLSGVEWV
jgi:hypothetical protein